MNLNYFKMMRFDHWVKNIFVLPGVILALIYLDEINFGLVPSVFFAFVASCLIASANYIINEWLDRAHDKLHPLNCNRPAALGLVSFAGVAMCYMALVFVGFVLAYLAGSDVLAAIMVFLISGIIYNVPPFRTKDIPYLDVLVESFNNPVRLYIGWLSVHENALIPLSLVVSYWSFGAFLMTCKRITDYKNFEDSASRMKFRPSLGKYSPLSLSTGAMAYACISSSLYAAFAVKYKFELILLLPLLLISIMAYFVNSNTSNSIASNPERVMQSKKFTLLILMFSLCFLILLWTDLPYLEKIFFDVSIMRK